MPFESPIDARDEMFRLFNDAWTAVPLVAELEVETRWQGKEKGDIPAGYFIRVSKTTVGSNSGGFLQNGDGPSDQVYDTFGNIFVQVFAPMDAEDAFRKGELLAIAARDIFRGVETISGAWFRKARYEELQNDGKHYRFNVIVEYEFSET